MGQIWGIYANLCGIYVYVDGTILTIPYDKIYSIVEIFNKYHTNLEFIMEVQNWSSKTTAVNCD